MGGFFFYLSHLTCLFCPPAPPLHNTPHSLLPVVAFGVLSLHPSPLLCHVTPEPPPLAPLPPIPSGLPPLLGATRLSWGSIPSRGPRAALRMHRSFFGCVITASPNCTVRCGLLSESFFFFQPTWLCKCGNSGGGVPGGRKKRRGREREKEWAERMGKKGEKCKKNPTDPWVPAAVFGCLHLLVGAVGAVGAARPVGTGGAEGPHGAAGAALGRGWGHGVGHRGRGLPQPQMGAHICVGLRGTRTHRAPSPPRLATSTAHSHEKSPQNTRSPHTPTTPGSPSQMLRGLHPICFDVPIPKHPGVPKDSGLPFQLWCPQIHRFRVPIPNILGSPYQLH